MPSPSRTRGPYAKTAERQASIARAALSIVSERGHAAVNTAEVAQNAGVSERLVFYHFPSRDHLLIAALEEADRESRQAIALPERDRAGLEWVVDNLTRTNAAQANKLRLAQALSAEAPNPDHPAHAYFTRHYEQALAGFAELVAARQAQGLAHPDLDPAVIARRMIAIWEGLQTQWLVKPDFDLADEVQQAFRQLSGQAAMEAKRAIDTLMATL